MAEINRRKFLLASAGVGAAGLLSGAVAIAWPELQRAAHDNPLASGTGVLVIVTLYGGNDGLSTVIPYTDNAYYDARRDLSYAPEDVIHLDGQLGLSPAWKGLAEVWNDRHLAIVRGVSYPTPDRSHFRSMDIWQTASPADPVRTGWIGRWLDGPATTHCAQSTSAPYSLLSRSANTTPPPRFRAAVGLRPRSSRRDHKCTQRRQSA